MPEVPDPLEQAEGVVETVHLLKSDFDALQYIANCALEDFYGLCEAMEVTAPPELTPHTFMQEVLIPGVRALVSTQQQVDDASAQIAVAASRFGHKSIEVNGVKGLKVGQRIPGLFDRG